MSDLPINDAVSVAETLATALDQQLCEYAVGGAIALGCWSQPRGTIDVGLTLFLPPGDIFGCLRIFDAIGVEYAPEETKQILTDHGFCRVQFAGRVLDVFLPTTEFYAIAKERRANVQLRTRSVKIWDAETLCVFKMMFFRRKDLADVEQLLRSQGDQLDVSWIDRHIEEIYGKRDPRASAWQEIVLEVRGA